MKLLPPILVLDFFNRKKEGARVKPKKVPQSFSNQLRRFCGFTAANCSKSRQIVGFCGELRQIAANCGKLRQIAANEQ